MAGDAGLEALTRRLPMSRTEELVGIVVTRTHWSTRDQAGLLVTADAELLVVVAVAAVGFGRVGGRGMAGEISSRVITGRITRVGPVTVETLGSSVTAHAIPRATPRHVGVFLVPIRGVSDRRVSRQ